MSLIEIQHVVADMYDVDPDWNFTTDGSIIEGSCVALTTSGSDTYVKQCTTTDEPFGLAGDTLTNTEPADATALHRPYQDALIINRFGATRNTSNRVSDFYDETRASGKMTVYNSGGKFATDQYDTADTFTVGSKVYANALGDVSTTDAGSQTVVGIVADPVAAQESGVPGTDVRGSITLGDFVTLVLRI